PRSKESWQYDLTNSAGRAATGRDTEAAIRDRCRHARGNRAARLPSHPQASSRECVEAGAVSAVVAAGQVAGVRPTAPRGIGTSGASVIGGKIRSIIDYSDVPRFDEQVR